MMRALALALVLACGSSQHPAPPSASASADKDFAAAADRFVAAHLAFRPSFAIDLGLHDYDGKVPDRSPAAIDGEIARLRAAKQTFTAFDDKQLSPQRRAERALLLAEIGKELLTLDTRRAPFRD